MEELVKLVVFVPETDADKVREAIGKTGAGRTGKYSYCSFSSKGIGRFKPEKGADPAEGEVGKMEEVEEERIEVVCPKELVSRVIAAIKEVHPYEEFALDVYTMLMVEND